MEFMTTEKIDKWVKNHNIKCKSTSTAGEHYQFKFIPTSIVEIQEVECLVCGKKCIDHVV